jgi:hypothetical protein
MAVDMADRDQNRGCRDRRRGEHECCLRASLRAGPLTKEIHALNVSRMRPACEITQPQATIEWEPP